MRAPSPDDERSVTVTLTEDGRGLLAKVLPGHVEVVNGPLFEPLSRDDVKALADLPASVRVHMRSTPPRSAGSRSRKGGAQGLDGRRRQEPIRTRQDAGQPQPQSQSPVNRDGAEGGRVVSSVGVRTAPVSLGTAS